MNSQPSQTPFQNFMIPGGNFGYKAVAVNDLLSSENTIVTGLVDESGSTSPWKRDIELCIKEIVKSLYHCPVADKLVYRHCHFDTTFKELHGFRPLKECKESDYDGCWAGGGQTALFKSECNVLHATLDYAKQQSALHFTVNALNFFVSDGENYLSSPDHITPDDVKKANADCITSEVLESLITIFIGVNPDDEIRRKLQEHCDYVGFTQFIPMEKANEKTLGQLAQWISKSIQSQSQHLGSGGPSQPLAPPSMTF